MLRDGLTGCNFSEWLVVLSLPFVCILGMVTIIQFAMSGAIGGIRDPLLQYFVEESAAKQVVIENLNRQVDELNHDVRVREAEVHTLLQWFTDTQARFNQYSRLLRSVRSRCAQLERRLQRYEPNRVSLVIDLTDEDSDPDPFLDEARPVDEPDPEVPDVE